MEESQANDNWTSLGNGTQAHIRALELSISDPVHKPQDQVGIFQKPIWAWQKLVSASLLWSSKCCQLPAPSPGSPCPPAGAGMAQRVSPYSVPRRCSGHADLHSPLRAWGTQGQGAAWLENPHVPCRALWGQLWNHRGGTGKNNRVCLRPRGRHATAPREHPQARWRGLAVGMGSLGTALILLLKHL